MGGFFTDWSLKEKFENEILNIIKKWAKNLPNNLMPPEYPFHSVFFEDMGDSKFEISTKQEEIRNKIKNGVIPEKREIITLILERRIQVLKYIEQDGKRNDAIPFFKVEEGIILPHIKTLAEDIYTTFIQNDRLHKITNFKLLKELKNGQEEDRRKIDEIRDMLYNFTSYDPLEASQPYFDETPVILTILICIAIREVTSKDLLANDINFLYKYLFKTPMQIYNIDSELKLLVKDNYIVYSGITIKLSKRGKDRLLCLTDKNWELIESITYDDNFRKHDISLFLIKYIVEKLPSKIRFKRLINIIKYLQREYYNECWKYKNGIYEISVPFQIIAEIKGKLLSRISEDTYNGNLEIDSKYIQYYKNFKRYTDGSVYRIVDLKKQKDDVVLEVAYDYGYFAFQATCGKIRNEIEHQIVNQDRYKELDLSYRSKTLHTGLNKNDIKKFMKKRVLKTGVEVCTIIVDHDDKGNIINPRIPIIFRNETVAEYPEFTMVVPSGAYQAGIEVKDKYSESEKASLINRVDWKFSLIRELGEELFRSKELDKSTIDNLGSLDYQISEKIIESALVCKAQAFGIDLYIGTGGIIVTLIMEYSKTIDVINSFKVKGKQEEIIDIMINKFQNLNTEGELNCKEGEIRLFTLDNEFLNIISNSYLIDRKYEVNKIKQYSTDKIVEFTPMIPSGVVSAFYAWEELIKRFNMNSIGVRSDSLKNSKMR